MKRLREVTQRDITARREGATVVRGRRVSFTRCLALMPALLALMVVATACDEGVSQEEFEAVQRRLSSEELRSRSLESELTQGKARLVALQAMVDDAEVQATLLESSLTTATADEAALREAADDAEVKTALLESMLAQAKADAENLRKSLDRAEAQQALLATFLAWNRKDSKAFTDGFTEGGMAASFLSLPGSIGEPTIAVRRIMETAASGDKAIIHAMYGLGTQRSSVIHSMVKENGTWKIDNEEKLSPKVRGNTETVDIHLHDCGFSFESTVISSRNVAFALYNVGEQAPRLVLSRVPGDIDLKKTLQGGGSASQGMGPIAFVDTLAPGDRINVAFTQPLAAGRYALLCFVPGPDNVELTDTVSGIVAELLVN